MCKFEVFMVMIYVRVSWVVTPYGVAVGYQHFLGPWCLHLHPEPSVPYCNTTQCHNLEDLNLYSFCVYGLKISVFLTETSYCVTVKCGLALVYIGSNIILIPL
jgi:hypothetical protein